LALFLHVISQLATIVQPLIFANVLNVLQTQPDDMISEIAWWAGAWIVSFIWFNVFHRVGCYFHFGAAYKTKQNFINKYYHAATELPLKWHTDHHSGDTINRINRAADSIHWFAVGLASHTEYFMLIWGPLITLSILSWPVALVAVGVILLSLLIMRLFDTKLVALYHSLNERDHKVAATLFDYISNIKTIITLRLGRRTEKELNHRIEQGFKPYMQAETVVNQFKWLTVSVMNLILEVGITFLYIFLQIAGKGVLLAGNVAAVYQYMRQLNSTFFKVAGWYQDLLQKTTDFQSAKTILEAWEKVDAKGLEKLESWNDIKISNLDFEYEAGKKTLQDIGLSFSKGEKIALVGESGSGKSSLMAIMRGLYEPQSVNLNLDSQALNTLLPLFSTTTLIPQEPEIFENTIGYNITVGIDYPENEVLEATRLACFDRVLDRLPNGLDTDVREKGVTLSGGERQRLALARGMLAAKNSSIILMDEPTSSVDAHNELSIYENIFKHFADCTVISSIHRLHLLGKFDQVVVMDQGKIVQMGTFKELKDQSGLFKILWDKYQESSKPNNR